MATAKQRRDAEKRHLQRQMEKRRQRQLSRRRANLIISVVGTLTVIALVIVLIAVTNGNSTKTTQAGASSPVPPTSAGSVPATAGVSSSAPRTPNYPCSWRKTGKPAKKAVEPASTKPAKTGKVSLAVNTTQGSLTFALDRSLAPCTVDSFVSLVKQKYYDATPCHRLTTAGIFVLQCGDPTGSGTGDPGYSIPDEATGQENYPAGTIAMARGNDPHSGGSQFFIVYKDSPNLKQGLGQLQYTVFGKISDGLKVITRVAAGGADTGTDGKPKIPIAISKISVPN